MVIARRRLRVCGGKGMQGRGQKSSLDAPGKREAIWSQKTSQTGESRCRWHLRGTAGYACDGGNFPSASSWRRI